MVPPEELDGARSRSRWRKPVLTAVPLLAIAAVVVVAALKPAPDGTKALPSFDLELLAGDGSLSDEDLDGKPAVLNFWASWCDPCKEETPLLQRTYEAYKQRGVLFVGVNTQDNPADARAFVEKYGVTYPVVVDEGRALSNELGVAPLPQTFFVRCDGTLLSVSSGSGEVRTKTPSSLEPRPGEGAYLGAIPEDELESKVETLLDDAQERC